MGELFHVRIDEVKAGRAVLRCMPWPWMGQGRDDSRSFALMLLIDAGECTGSATLFARRAPEGVRERLIELANDADGAWLGSSLRQAINWPADSDKVVDEDWHRATVPRIVQKVEVVREHNVGVDGEAIAKEIDASGLDEWGKRLAYWERLYSFELAITTTQPKFLDHLVRGYEFGTAGFAVWDESKPAPPPPAPDPRLAALDEKYDARVERLLDALVTKQLIEIDPDHRSGLVDDLTALDAEDEEQLCAEFLRVIGEHDAVAEIFGSDEELFSEIKKALR